MAVFLDYGGKMKAENPKPARHRTAADDLAPTAVSTAATWIQGVAGCIYRSTKRYIKNIPSRVQNKYLRYRNEKSRMPKRTGKNRVYVLVGYTSKANIDRRFRAEKLQNMIRRTLLILILIVSLVITYKMLFDQFGDTEEFKQIIGINGIDDLTGNDPFGAAGETTQFVISTIPVTPTPGAEITGSESGTP